MEHLTSQHHAHFDVNCPMLEKPLYVCERGNKYIAIDVINYPSNIGQSDHLGRSVYCFIAAQDGETKDMGKVKRGDILRPDGYKKPAKHARGNLFDQSTWTCAGIYGVAYLK